MSEDDPLDLALRAAFSARADAPASVVERLRAEGAGVTPLLLRDEVVDAEFPLQLLSSETRTRLEGRYQVLGEIARGGVGVILKGHDVDLGRDVAMKVLREEHLAKRDVLQRFVEEAQIGGQLQHPGIVPVYELGLRADKRPFFTMKLVKGRTLAALLRERSDSADERRRWLAIFEAVCQTIAYAHSRGVVHRDLKPSNVMVGAFGEVLVVDWGMGKVLRQGGLADEQRSDPSASRIETVRSGSGSSHSVAGSLMGTPAYMPPEQARGEVDKLDERSDVFALGAILCEILSGSPPYLGESDELVTQAASADLSSAFERLASCAADPELVRIAKSCLSPAAAARPKDAGALATEIGAYLGSIEERARAAQLEAAQANVKAAGERKARKLTVALAASMLATILLGGGGYLWTTRQRAQAQRETESSVLAALSDATVARGQGEWPEALSAVERARALTRSGVASDDLRARVEREGTEIERDAGLARSRDALERDNAALLAELENVRQPEGSVPYPTDWARLDENYGELFARHGLRVDEGSEDELCAQLAVRGIASDLASALDEWALIRRARQSSSGADRLSYAAGVVDPDPLRQRMRAAVAAKDRPALRALEAEIEVGAQPASTLRLLAMALRREEMLAEAVDLLQRARRAHPSDFLLAMELGRRLMQLQPPRADEAARTFEAALALRPDSVEAWHELGKTLSESLTEHRAAAEIFRAALARRADDAHLEFHLGEALRRDRRPSEAIPWLQRSIEHDPDYALTRFALGDALSTMGRTPEAEVEFQRAIELNPSDVASYQSLARMWTGSKRIEELLPPLRRALERNPDSAALGSMLGTLLLDLGRFAEALPLLERAVLDAPTSGRAHFALSTAHYKNGQIELAIAGLERATELEPGLGEAWSNLGSALHDLGRIDEAIAAARRAIEINPELVDPHNNLGSALFEKGDVEGAIAEMRIAVGLAPHMALLHHNLGSVLLHLSRPDEAVDALRKAVELAPEDGESRRLLGRALISSSAIDEGIEESLRSLELSAANSFACVTIAGELAELHVLDRAIEAQRARVDADPSSVPARIALGIFLQQAERNEEALVELRRAVELAPGVATTHIFLGNAARDAGEFELAERELRSAIEVAPTDSWAYNMLGNLLQSRGELDRAIEQFRLATVVAPQYATAHANLGQALIARGELGAGVEACRRAATLEPRTAHVRLRFGQALRAAGDLDGALGEFRAAVALDPTTHDAHAALARELALAEREDLRDAEQALEHARKALELTPDSPADRDALGFALYVHGDYDEAILVLEGVVSSGGETPLRELFLALCHHQRDDAWLAERAYRRAEPGLDALSSAEPALRRFVEEARTRIAAK